MSRTDGSSRTRSWRELVTGLRLGSAALPAETGLAVCPHCWHVNFDAERPCQRCGADMRTLLQESGGLRMTAPVQSPVPVRAAERLSPLLRFVLLVLVALLALAALMQPFLPVAALRRPVDVPGAAVR